MLRVSLFAETTYGVCDFLFLTHGSQPASIKALKVTKLHELISDNVCTAVFQNVVERGGGSGEKRAVQDKSFFSNITYYNA
jgi:hypothetical protein